MAPAGTTNLLWFQGVQPDDVRVESSSVCFPEIELMSFDPQHVLLQTNWKAYTGTFKFACVTILCYLYTRQQKQLHVFKYSQKQLLQMRLSQTAESAPSTRLYTQSVSTDQISL